MSVLDSIVVSHLCQLSCYLLSCNHLLRQFIACDCNVIILNKYLPGEVIRKLDYFQHGETHESFQIRASKNQFFFQRIVLHMSHLLRGYVIIYHCGDEFRGGRWVEVGNNNCPQVLRTFRGCECLTCGLSDWWVITLNLHQQLLPAKKQTQSHPQILFFALFIEAILTQKKEEEENEIQGGHKLQ